MPPAISKNIPTSIILLILLFLTFICHGLSLQAEFMCDDFYYLQPDHLKYYYGKFFDFFLRFPGHHYNPLDVILNFYLFKLLPSVPLYFYGFNLILFFTNSFLFFLTVRAFTKDQFIALLSAVLFVIHPVNAENLSHITFNTVFSSAIFLQLSLLGFWRYIAIPQQKKRWFYLSLLSFFLALLFLETALLFPACLCALSLLKPVRERLRVLLLSLPYWAGSISYFILWCSMTRDGGHQLNDKINHLNISLTQYFATLGLLFKWYIGNLFFPDDLVFIKSSPVIFGGQIKWILGLMAYSTVIILLILLWRKTQKSFAIIWFIIGFVFMLPASLIHAYSMGMVLEPHWFFFSSMGFFMCIALLLADIKPHINLVIYRSLIGVIIFFWAITSYRHHVIAQTEVSYLEYWLKISPGNTFPALRLGNLYGLRSYLKIPEILIPEMDRQADLFIKKKQYTEAAALIEKMIQSQPQHRTRQIWDYTLTALHTKIGTTGENSLLLERFKSEKLTEPEYLLMATQLDKMELRDQAILILDRGLFYIPESSHLLCLKALILANADRFEEAEAVLRAKAKEMPEDSQFASILKEIAALKATYDSKK